MADSGKKKKSEIIARLRTAAVLLPALGLVWYGGPIAALFYIFVNGLIGLEIIKVKGGEIFTLRSAGILAAILIPAANLLAVGLISPLASVIAAMAMLIAFERVWITAGILTASMLMCFCFVGLTLDGSQHWLLLLIAVVIATDSAAFFGGRFFGGAKLMPMISPSKTWSGAVCGLIGGAVAASIVAPVLGISTLTGVIMGVLIADFSIGGDLLESWFKRRHKVKDTGNILPGHGGILDRCDGYLLSAPLVYGAVTLVGING